MCWVKGVGGIATWGGWRKKLRGSTLQAGRQRQELAGSTSTNPPTDPTTPFPPNLHPISARPPDCTHPRTHTYIHIHYTEGASASPCSCRPREVLHVLIDDRSSIGCTNQQPCSPFHPTVRPQCAVGVAARHRPCRCDMYSL